MAKLSLIKDCIRTEVSLACQTKEIGRRFLAGRSKIGGVLAVKAIIPIIKDSIDIVIRKKFIIAEIELVITTKCSLRCKECSNLMQYYETPNDIDLEILMNTIRSLEKNCDRVLRISILGGEPFVSSNFYTVLRELNQSRVFKSVYILTNGTVLLERCNAKLMEEIRNEKVCLHVSDYKHKNIEKNLQFMQNQSIKYVFLKDMKWSSWGNLDCRHRSEDELKRQFKQCSHTYCKSILNGKLYYCPREAHATDLEIIVPGEEKCIDLLATIDKEELQSKIITMFYKSEFMEACNYCDQGTTKSIDIPVAEQVDIEKKQD